MLTIWKNMKEDYMNTIVKIRKTEIGKSIDTPGGMYYNI